MGIIISDIEYHLPNILLTNTQIKKSHPSWDVDKISLKTGVYNRHISEQGETAYDLSVHAVKKLLNNSNIRKEDIGGIIFCTQSPDYIMPSNSFLIHKEFNFPSNVWCFDYNLACSGYIYGLAIARGLLDTKMANHILLINADTYSKYINSDDRSTSLLFGDGSAASILTFCDEDSLLDIALASDGSAYQSFYIPAGGIRTPYSDNTSIEIQDIVGNFKSKENIHMDGKKVFNFISKTVPIQISNLLKKNNLEINDISQFIFHQASMFTIDALINTLGLDISKCFINIENIGNTVSASIPIALKNAIDQGKIKKGDIILLSGFGVGLSWGTTLLKF